MVIGPMRFGTTNNAGDSSTELTAVAPKPTLVVINTADRNRGVYALHGQGNYAGVAATGSVYGVVANGQPPQGSLDLGQGVIAGGRNVGVTAFAVQPGTSVSDGVRAFGLKSGVFATSERPGRAGDFRGDVSVTGNLTKGGGGFRIDHPLDPANKYLSHSFVEAPERLNVYSGTVSTDADGAATVTLPEYFDALNTDLRYQLTVIGQFAQAMVADEVSGNQFTIRTDQPNVKVSWQVSGVRQDPFAVTYPIVAEEDKPPEERGAYLHPESYDRPESEGVDYQRVQQLLEIEAETRESLQARPD
jgi:hypothetical protein